MDSSRKRKGESLLMKKKSKKVKNEKIDSTPSELSRSLVYRLENNKYYCPIKDRETCGNFYLDLEKKTDRDDVNAQTANFNKFSKHLKTCHGKYICNLCIELNLSMGKNSETIAESIKFFTEKEFNDHLVATDVDILFQHKSCVYCRDNLVFPNSNFLAGHIKTAHMGAGKWEVLESVESPTPMDISEDETVDSSLKLCIPKSRPEIITIDDD